MAPPKVEPQADSQRVSTGEFPLDHGSVYFKMHRADADAEFIRCRMGVDKNKIVKHAVSEWLLDSNPGVLMRIIGTTPSAARPGEQHGDFVSAMEGVLKAANISSAWLFSTGLDFGMGSAVGTTLGRSRHHCTCPLIGFTEWGVVQGSDQLLKGANGKPASAGSKRVYTDCQPNDDMSTVSLQANHSHYVLVGGEGDEGYTPPDSSLGKKEVLMQARKRAFLFEHEFERAMAAFDGDKAREDKIPRVLMVLCGDETTLLEVLEYCRHDSGIVVFSQPTGGLADVMTRYVYNGVLDPEWAHFKKEFEEIRDLNEKKFQALQAERKAARSGFDQATASSYFLPGAQGQYPYFSFVLKRGIIETSMTVLDAVMVQITSPRAKVCAAVQWDDGERMEQIFTTMVPAWLADRADILREATQLALEKERSACIKVLVDLAAPVAKLNLLSLYDKLYDLEEPPRFPMYIGYTMPTLAREQVEEKIAASPMGSRKTLLRGFQEKSKNTPVTGGTPQKRPSADKPPGLTLQKSAGGTEYEELTDEDINAVYEFYPKEVWATLEEVVPGLCLYWRDILAKRDAAAADEDEAEDLAAGTTVGARWIDIYVWAVLLGNEHLATMLLPACQEPMRAAVIGARIFDYMASRLPLNAVELSKSAESQEAWACKLLDQCDNFQEARRMLITKSNQWQRTVLHLAVQSGLRNFCAHHYCQTLCDEWYRGNSDFDGTVTVLRSREAPGPLTMLQYIGFAALPIPQIWGKDLLEWSLASGSDPRKDYPTIKPTVATFYQIPQVKGVMRLFFHIMYTIFMSMAAMETNNGKNAKPNDKFLGHITMEFHSGVGYEKWQVELIGAVWTFSLIMDEWYKYIQDPSTFQADFWNKYDYFALSATVVGLSVRWINLDAATEVLAFCSLLIWCRIFKYLGSNQSIGLLVIMIMQMFKDIVLWALVSSIFLAAFTVAFVTISDPEMVEASTGDHPLTVPIWAMLGQFDNHEVATWNGQVGELLLWTYLVVSNIVLVNLLIAMMGDTYGVIKEKADEEWKFGRLRSVVEATERMSPIPPPLNLPITCGYFLWRLLPESCQKCFSCLEMTVKDKTENADAVLIAQNKKRKVARRLLLGLKATEEADEADSVLGRLAHLAHEQREVEESVAEVSLKIEKLEKEGSVRSPAPKLNKPPSTTDPPKSKADVAQSAR